MKIEIVDSIEKIKVRDWQQLANKSSFFSSYQFFQCLENSHSVSTKQGWQPHHLKFTNINKKLATHSVDAILPAYIKSHSWGEYVFDWAWADAFHQHNLAYYPKLVATIPFTPVSSNKLLSNKLPQQQLFTNLTEHCQQLSLNSWHILFAQTTTKSATQSTCLTENNIFQRNTVQFLWLNYGYQNFDDFLAKFTARKRKNTRKERLSIAQQGIQIRRIYGKDISEKELAFFYLTYQLTYMKRGHTPHLTFEFFQSIIKQLPDNILLVIATNAEGEDIASAWFFYDNENLYGRYWGCTKSYNNLHFELCYYQGIEFCIENKLALFHPGTQGEHKIQRGFEPKLTTSYHWIKHPAFRPAIKAFCLQEQQQMQNYKALCQLRLPFKALNTET